MPFAGSRKIDHMQFDKVFRENSTWTIRHAVKKEFLG